MQFFFTSACSIQHFSCQIKVNELITYIIDCDNDRSLRATLNKLSRCATRVSCSLFCVNVNLIVRRASLHILRQTNGTNRYNSLQFDIFAIRTAHSKYTHNVYTSMRFIAEVTCMHCIHTVLFVYLIIFIFCFLHSVATLSTFSVFVPCGNHLSVCAC